MILLIETATNICSVGITDEHQLLIEKKAALANSHASQLTLLIQAVLKDINRSMNDLKAVAVSIGPGSYTGLRIGLSTAKGICFALNIPLIAIDTLESIAHGMKAHHPDFSHFVPMIDARRMEVYTAIYNHKLEEVKAKHAKIIDASSFSEWFSEQQNKLALGGNGAPKCEPLLASDATAFLPVECSAAHLAQLARQAYQNGGFSDLAYVEPAYLKSPNITKPKKLL